MGGSLASIFEDTAQVRIWDTDPSRCRNAENVEEFAKGADIIFVCVPSWAVRKSVQPVAGILSETAVVVSLSKGMDAAGLTADRVLADLLPQTQPIVVLGGPLLAEEVGGQRSGMGLVASPDESARSKVRDILEKAGLFVEESEDADSTALAGTLKNVYALFIGMVYELGYGENLHGYFLARCCNELEEVGYELGGDTGVLRGTAGLGDFLATSLSEGSLNVSVGRDWITKDGDVRQSEGLVSIAPLWGLLEKEAGEFPLLDTLYEIVHEGGNARELIAELL